MNDLQAGNDPKSKKMEEKPAKDTTVKISPLAPKKFPNMYPVPGVEMGAMASGVRYKNRLDLMMFVFAEGTQAAGVFTKSKAPGAPVDWTKNALAQGQGQARALVVNAGNANAFTGAQGEKTTAAVADAVTGFYDCPADQIMQASTGVIGEPLSPHPLIKGLCKIKDGLSCALWPDAARAIMTTDTFPKGSSRKTSIHGEETVITGIAKGSGMIAPDMATMLGFVCTNAALTADCLKAVLRSLTDQTFNAITVDSDTSTSDMVLAFATGARAGYGCISDPDDPALNAFKADLQAVMKDLAQQVVKDGEGATKFVQIDIVGAEDDSAAKTIALSVANSPLVKTALAGEDPNWGRLIMAAAKSGEAVNRDQMQLWIGDQLVAKNGAVCRRYSEEKAAAHMKGQNILLKIDVGVSGADTAGTAQVWTCDMTHDYISINADYRS